MKDHTLLQAVCRTNRVYEAQKKCGLIVDYVGVFDDYANALRFDEASVKTVIKNINEVKACIPEFLKDCLDFFPGVDRTIGNFRGLQDAQECLKDENVKAKFCSHYTRLHKCWEVVSLGNSKHSGTKEFKLLSQKLKELQEKLRQQQIDSIQFLKDLLALAKEVLDTEKELNQPKDQRQKAKDALTELFESIKTPETPIVVENVVNDIDTKVVDIVRRFNNAFKTVTGQNEVRKMLRSILWLKYKIKDNDVFEKAYKYVAMYYNTGVDALETDNVKAKEVNINEADEPVMMKAAEDLQPPKED